MRCEQNTNILALQLYLVSDVSGEQHPHSSSPCWTLDLQLVLRIVGQAVDVLHWALLPIPTTAEQTKPEQTLQAEWCSQIKTDGTF